MVSSFPLRFEYPAGRGDGGLSHGGKEQGPWCQARFQILPFTVARCVNLAMYLTSLSLRFSICKMEVLRSTIPYEDERIDYISGVWCSIFITTSMIIIIIKVVIITIRTM